MHLVFIFDVYLVANVDLTNVLSYPPTGSSSFWGTSIPQVADRCRYLARIQGLCAAETLLPQ